MIRLLWQAALVCLLTVPAWSTTLYSDGAINGSSGGEFVCCGSETTDSFTIAANADATGVSNIGLWVTFGDTPLLINWIISTAPDGGGTVEASASGVSLTTAFNNNVGTSYTVYNASFSLPSVLLGPGTYYLELNGGTTELSSGGPYWDENGGPSTADVNGTPGISNSFEVDGSFTGIPEPATLGTIGAGLGLLGLLARRRKRA
jgi:hypothetical protein